MKIQIKPHVPLQTSISRFSNSKMFKFLLISSLIALSFAQKSPDVAPTKIPDVTPSPMRTSDQPSDPNQADGRPSIPPPQDFCSDCPMTNKCCPPGSYFNFDQFRCLCYRNASSTGICEAPFNLAYPMKCCICPNKQCLGSAIFDVNKCACICPKQQCPIDSQIRDPSNGCRCQCTKILPCTYPQTWNTKTCSCFCPNDCASNMIQDKETCKCSCRQQPTCPSNKIEKNCQCVCPKVKNCEPGQIWSNEKCQCGCGDFQTQDCVPPSKFNPKNCLCECPNQSAAANCKSPKIWHQKECKCRCEKEEAACVKPQIMDSNMCSCQCSNRVTIKCACGFDEQNCKCIECKG